MVVRNSLYNLAGQILIKIISFSFMIFVVRQLGSVEFGKYAIATAFVGLLMVMCDLGIAAYFTREVARDHKQIENLLGNLIALRFTLAVVFIIVATCSAILLGYAPEIVIGILMGSSSQLLFAVQSSLDALLIGSERLGSSALANVVNQLVLASSGVLILLLWQGFLGLSIATLLGILAATIFNVYSVRKRIGIPKLRVTPRLWPHIIRKSLPFGINQFALSLTYRLDSLMLGWFWGNALVGMYGAAYNLIFTLVTISNSVNLALFPRMGRDYARDPDAAHRNFGYYLRFLFILSLPMAAIGSVLAEPLAHLLFSKAYTESGAALQILVWALPLMFLNELLGYIAATLGQEKSMALLRLVNAFSNLAMNSFAIPTFGIMGASITTVLTEAVGIIQFVVLFRKQRVFPTGIGWLLKPGIAAGTAALVAFLLSSLPVLLVGAIALIVYIVGLLVTGGLEREEIRLLTAAFKSKTGNTNQQPEPEKEILSV